MFKKYRKKPVVIEAKQWFPPPDERHDPSMVVERKGNQVDPPDYRQVGDLYCAMPVMPGFNTVAIYMIRTLEGDMKLSPGDYVVIGVHGEKYCVKPDIFEASYDEVNDG